MAVTRTNVEFAKRIGNDRVGNDYVFGGNWNPFNLKVGTDCSGCVIDICDAVRNGTAMAWTRHGMSTESWRPIEVGQTGTIFNTVCVASPNDFPPDAAVKIAIHHGPGGGANSHMWCEVDGVRFESNGTDGCVTGNRARSVYDTSYANDWHYIPGPISDAAPGPDPAVILSNAMGGSVSLDRYRALLPAVVQCLDECGCDTVVRRAMWMAQIGHESVGLKYMEEIASGSQYEGRTDLGNTQPSDGVRFKGRGPIQVTGRHNYTVLSQWAFEQGLVPSPTFFVDQPQQLASDAYGFIGVTWYWTTQRPMNDAADARDIVRATQYVNGGQTGIEDRRTRYNRALAIGTDLLKITTGDDELSAEAETFIREIHGALFNRVSSKSIYRDVGEDQNPHWQLHELIKNDDGMIHQDYVERLAKLGNQDSLARIVRTAAGKGAVTDQWAVQHAAAVLNDIEATTPALLQAFINIQNGATA